MAEQCKQEPHQRQPLKEPLKKRAVVSSFIFKFPEDGKGKPLVALFRRERQGKHVSVSESLHCISALVLLESQRLRTQARR